MTIDIEKARRNMISQQIRAWDVLDNETLDLLAQTPREQFVPEQYRDLAFADTCTPIGHGQVMLPPKEEGRIIQSLKILPTETVLEVGTGSGYMTALLAKLAHHVYSVDILPEMTAMAHTHIGTLNIDNVTLETGDASESWTKHSPYDLIVITGSLPELSEAFKQSVNIDGRIFAILGDAPAMQATLFTRTDKDTWETDVLYETVVPRLQNVKERKQFNF